MSGNTYALIVGITKYDPTILLEGNSVLFPELGGCINDANKISDFLKENCLKDRLFLEQLFNEDATKDNVCNRFLKHLGKADKNDAVFFYYSGHGTQEFADECFTWETDGKLESIVTFYNNANKENCLISDKEIRFLISKLAERGCHITLVLDCCHSGDASRAAELILNENYDRPIEKKSRGSFAFSRRPWENFIFHEEISPKEVKERKGLGNEGRHILFSACKSNESAFEIAGEGVFTKNLIKVLKQTSGVLSNQRLIESVSIYMDTAYRQKPSLYAPPFAADLLKTGFINRSIGNESDVQSFFNPRRGWMINRGQLNGLSQDTPSFNLLDPSNPDLKFSAKIKSTDIDRSEIIVEGEPDIAKTFNTDLSGFTGKPIKLFLSLDNISPSESEKFLSQILPLQPEIVELVNESSQAEYIYHFKDRFYYITKSTDTARPLTEVLNDALSDKHAKDLSHLYKWEAIKGIARKQTAGDIPLKIEYRLEGQNEFISLTDQERDSLVIENWKSDEKGRYKTKLEIRLTNTSEIDIHVGVLYLDINFGSGKFLLNPSPYQLGPGETVFLSTNKNPELTLVIPDQVRLYNNENYEETLKFIVSDTPFDLHTLVLRPLPEPPDLSGASRGAISEFTDDFKPVFEGWYVFDLKMISVNPTFNKISRSQLKKMLEDEVVSLFAEQLFFEPSREGEPFEVRSVLKNEILLDQSDDPNLLRADEKSVIIDLANWYAREKRRKQYERISRQFPDRLKVVSEGDSWFQHPLVYDIIDHLSNIYAIRCVAAAGDTLSNYLSGEKENGEYFLNTLETIKPKLFLISGGGNDILGSQFRNFLVDQPYNIQAGDDKDPAHFLKQNFKDKIEALMSIYEAIFSILKSRFPEMKTIVHGYDYPVHLDQTKKGWLGRYMIEKGISKHEDRLAVIKFIMDQFNEGLARVAGQFKETVFYLNLRGTVKYRENELDQWYDEIHPNSEGFQLISLKYISLINSLVLKN